MRVLVVALLVLGAVACNSIAESPAAPTPIPAPSPAPSSTNDLTGTWFGTMNLNFHGERGSVDTRTEIQQVGAVVNGTWLISTLGNDAFGRIDGNVWFVDGTLQFQGIVTWQSSAQGGGRCVGQTGFSGQVFDRELTWRAPTIDFGDTCDHAFSDISWVMTR